MWITRNQLSNLILFSEIYQMYCLLLNLLDLL